MDINSLEKMARRVFRGENINEMSDKMVSSGVLTPAEHRSLKSLSSQIAANLQMTSGVRPQLVAISGPNPSIDARWA